jgi:hypothetical protein
MNLRHGVQCRVPTPPKYVPLQRHLQEPENSSDLPVVWEWQVLRKGILGTQTPISARQAAFSVRRQRVRSVPGGSVTTPQQHTDCRPVSEWVSRYSVLSHAIPLLQSQVVKKKWQVY